jgi:hypothetical protein
MAAGIGRQVTAITTATTTTVLTAPASGDFKRVANGMISIRNKGASDTVITLQMDVSATNYESREFTLPTGGDWVNGDREYILTSTDALEIVTGTATDVDVIVSYLELT